MKRKWKVISAGFLLCLFICAACSSLKRYNDTQNQLALMIPQEEPLPEEEEPEAALVDTSSVHDGPIIMNAIRDSKTGEMTATDVIVASKVTARFRNIAERLGQISLAFDVAVPSTLIDSDYQLRLSPMLTVFEDTSALEPIYITGAAYRKRQLRGYERYRNFIESIITDTTMFIRREQLETFLERYFPETYAMKNDSSIVPEPSAENLFGVNQTMALIHYTRQNMKKRNIWKMNHKDEMFRKYVKSPFTGGVRLDTVMSTGDGTMLYRYSHTMSSAPGLRKIMVNLNGSVYRDGEEVAQMISPENLTFYISSLSSLADNTPRYLYHVMSRLVTDNTDAILDFGQGSTTLDTLKEGNAAELRRIRKCFDDVCSKKELVLDSVVVTASCSPEGSWKYNEKLAKGRAQTVRKYVLDEIPGLDKDLILSKSVPENWETLLKIVKNDSLIGEKSRELIIAASQSPDKDEAERRFSALPEFRHLREKIYPRLRTVNFGFYMHRPDMQKDTIHTTELDTVYMRGVEALKNLDYKTAAAVLRPYGDYNSALALASSGYDDPALAILARLEAPDAKSDYLAAVLLSRLGEFSTACEYFKRCVEKDPSMRHRANLDPEMAEVLREYEPDLLSLNNL